MQEERIDSMLHPYTAKNFLDRMAKEEEFQLIKGGGK